MKNDVKLIKELKRNSEKAFKKVYDQYKNLVYYQAYCILNNKEDAEDVLQNTFIKFMKNIEYIDDDSSLNQLLSKMSKNEAIDMYRKKVKRNETLDDNINTYKEDDFDNSKVNVILTLNNALKPLDASIIALKIIFDYSFEDIAQELNESIGVVQARYYKAIKVLKSYYKGV